jgi:hypothetical protein
MCLGDGGAKASQQAAAQQRKEEQDRQNRIRQGNSRIDQIFSPFNEGFFKGRSKAFLDFTRPQLEDQYKKAREGLVFALSRNGLIQSSAGANKFRDLTKTYDTNRQVLEGQAIDEANKARAAVEQNRGDLTAQLQATADPTAAARSAIQRQAVLSATPGFNPLGILFQNITAGLADATSNPRNNFSGVNLFNSGSTTKSGSSRVVNN